LVLPAYTTSTPGPTFSNSQLAFAGVVSLALYGVFIFVQTVRHRDYFLPDDVGNEDAHAPPVLTRVALLSMALLFICLLAVVGLAKSLSSSFEAAVIAAWTPAAVVGVAIARSRSAAAERQYCRAQSRLTLFAVFLFLAVVP
jgi:Ca2+:H+ antiporter